MPGLRRYEPQIYAIMRIIIGLLFVEHGLNKLAGWPGAAHEMPAFVLYIAGPIELVGGLLVAIGLFADWAAFLCSGLMAFAYFLAHAKNGFFPIVNQGEPAVVYCFIFLYIAARGSGIWSVDSLREPAGARVTVNVKAPGASATTR